MYISSTQYDRYLWTAASVAAGCSPEASEGNELAQSVIGGAALCAGFPIALKSGKFVLWDAPKWTYQNFGNYRQGFGNIWQGYKDSRNAHNQLINGLKGEHWWNTAGNYAKHKEFLELSGRLKDIKEARKAHLDAHKNAYKEARKLLEEIKAGTHGKAGSKTYNQALKKLESLVNQGDLKILEGIKAGTIKPVGIWQKFKNASGINWYNRQVAKGLCADTTKIGGKIAKGAAKFCKGGGPLAFAIELGVEAPEIVQTYKKLGAKKGTKQLAKSAAVAGAAAAGWVVGAKVGGIAGAKLGAVIGTCFGPVGTAIGGVIGTIVGVGIGIGCSFLAGKGMKALVGKSELEKAAEEKRSKLYAEAKKDKKKAGELLNTCAQKYEQGEVTEGQIVALQKLDEALAERENAAAANISTDSGTSLAQTDQSLAPPNNELLNSLQELKNSFGLSLAFAGNNGNSSNPFGYSNYNSYPSNPFATGYQNLDMFGLYSNYNIFNRNIT